MFANTTFGRQKICVILYLGKKIHHIYQSLTMHPTRYDKTDQNIRAWMPHLDSIPKQINYRIIKAETGCNHIVLVFTRFPFRWTVMTHVFTRFVMNRCDLTTVPPGSARAFCHLITGPKTQSLSMCTKSLAVSIICSIMIEEY